MAVEGKLTQTQITSEYGVHATQVKAWKQTALKAIDDVFSGAHEKDKKAQEQLVDDLYCARPQTEVFLNPQLC